MLRWGVVLSAGLLVLAVAGPARAQVPSASGSGMNFVPVDTRRNLAAPIPLVPQQPKKSFLSRTYGSVKSLNPFAAKAPSPTAQLPKNKPGPGLTLPKIPEMPRVSDVISGSAR